MGDTHFIERCSICLTDLEDRIKILRCDHSYHTECIDQWLNIKDICPICRTTTKEIKEKSYFWKIFDFIVNLTRSSISVSRNNPPTFEEISDAFLETY